MKTLTLLTALCLISVYSYSQWSDSGQAINYFGNVGINDSLPVTSLSVKGNAEKEDVLIIKNNYTSNYFSYAAGESPFLNASLVMNRSRGNIGFPTELMEGDRIGGIFARPFIGGDFQRAAAIHMYVGKNPGWYSYPTNIRFETTGTNEVVRSERMRIDENGNIGIATTEPKARLEVADGDIYISDIGKGIIMKSPDGNCWRGTLDNTGTLSFTRIYCPESSTTYVQGVKNSGRISFYPNPAKDVLFIDIEDSAFTEGMFILSDMTGKQLKKGRMKSNKSQINIGSLAPGMYLMNIEDNSGRLKITNKIIKD